MSADCARAKLRVWQMGPNAESEPKGREGLLVWELTGMDLNSGPPATGKGEI